MTPLRSSSALLLFALAALPARAAYAQPPAQPHAATVTPPQVLEHVDASYPQSRMGESLETPPPVPSNVTSLVSRALSARPELQSLDRQAGALRASA